MESKRMEAQVGKVLSFKPQIGKVKTDQTTGGFTIISPFLFFLVDVLQIIAEGI